MSGMPLQSPLRTISVLVVHLLLAHFCRGQSQLIGPPQPTVATVGNDVILPCHLEPAVDVAAKTLEWTRSNLNPRFVHVWRAGQDLVNVKNPSYKGRTSLFTDELKHGNISLKLSKVKPSDEGRYKCYFPEMNKDSFVELVVGAVASPVTDLAGIDRDKGGVMLDCKSKGWHPEPEVLWLDGEGNLLSAGPTETVRGPDDLYTVSSRVTVEKRHSNSFTCRVQQKNINQTRETHIHVPDDFFEVQSSPSPATSGLAVSLAVCIVVILLLVFVVWRQNKNKTKRSHCDETDTGEKKKLRSKTKKTEDQFVAEEEREREQLMTDETVVLKGKGEKKTEHQLQEEQQRREDAENRVKTLREELETKKNEVEIKRAELQQLHEEKQKKENEMQTLKEELKKKELERILVTQGSFSRSEGPCKEAEKEVERVKKNLETHQMELDTKIKKFDSKKAEVQQLQGAIKRIETNLWAPIETNNIKFERSRAAPVRSSSSLLRWPTISRQKLQVEQQRREEAENKVQILEEELQRREEELQRREEELQTKIRELQQEKQEAQREVKTLKNQLESKNKEVGSLTADVKKLKEEKQTNENNKKQLQTELETKKKELHTSKHEVPAVENSQSAAASSASKGP